MQSMQTDNVDDLDDAETEETPDDELEREPALTREQELELVYHEASELLTAWPGPIGVTSAPTVKRSRSTSQGIDVYFASHKIPQDLIAIAAHGMPCRMQGPIAALAERLEITADEAGDLEEGWNGLTGEGPMHAIGFRLRSEHATIVEASKPFDLAGMQRDQRASSEAIARLEVAEIAEERVASQRRREDWEAEARARRAAREAAKRARQEAAKAS